MFDIQLAPDQTTQYQTYHTEAGRRASGVSSLPPLQPPSMSGPQAISSGKDTGPCSSPPETAGSYSDAACGPCVTPAPRRCLAFTGSRLPKPGSMSGRAPRPGTYPFPGLPHRASAPDVTTTVLRAGPATCCPQPPSHCSEAFRGKG